MSFVRIDQKLLYKPRDDKMIIRTYSYRGVDMEYTSADDITKIDVIDEESGELIKQIDLKRSVIK